MASIARLPSSTDDPSGSTADRHKIFSMGSLDRIFSSTALTTAYSPPMAPVTNLKNSMTFGWSR